MNRDCQRIQDCNGIQGGVIFTEFPQPFTYLGIDDMDIVVDGFKSAEIRWDAAAFLVDEILGQEKHSRCPVNLFFRIGKRQVVPRHGPEISGMGAAAGRDNESEQ
jgi:hypothetical protein